MSYAIFDVVYGVPLSSMAQDLINEWSKSGDDRYFETVDKKTNYGGCCGFVGGYSANSESNYFCGVTLCEFSECSVVNLDNLKIKPTDDQIKEFEDKWLKVPEELKSLCEGVGVYLIPSSS